MTASFVLDRSLRASVPRDVVVMSGPEAADYLHGQLSADITALEPGGSTLSFLLEPRGRVEALMRVSRTGPETFVADTEPGFGEPIAASLNRFKLRTRIEIDCGQWAMHALRGPLAPDELGEPPTLEASSGSALTRSPPESAEFRKLLPTTASAAEAEAPDADAAPDHVALRTYWPFATGHDVLTSPGSAPPHQNEAAEPVSAAEFEALRMAFGLPAMGTEIQPGDIPNETGVVERAASFTKGCYRGQELVERIDSRTGGRRTIRRFRAEAQIAPGHELRDADGAAVGSVLSAASLVGACVGFVRTQRDAAADVRSADGAPVLLAELF